MGARLTRFGKWSQGVFLELALPWWTALREVAARVFHVGTRPPLVIYALLCILIFGGAGTWVTFLLHEAGAATARDVTLSAATYVLAVTGTGLADSLIDRERQDSTTLKLVLILFAILCCVPVGQAILDLLTHHVQQPGASPKTVSRADLAWWTLPCTIVWVVANARDPKFNVDPQAAAGGNPMSKL